MVRGHVGSVLRIVFTAEDLALTRVAPVPT